MGSSNCHLSNLKNGNVPCRYFLYCPVNSKIVQSCLSNLQKYKYYFFLMSIGVMSPVDFNERPCHPVEFKGQGSPLTAARRGSSPHPILTTTLDGFYLHGQYSQHSPRPNPPHNRQVLDPLSPPLLPTPPFPLPWLHYHKAAMGASSGGLLQPAGGRAFLQTMTLRKACSFRIYYYTPMTLF